MLRLVVFGKRPQQDRLRTDSERIRTERSHRLERVHRRPTDLEQPFSLGRRCRVITGGGPVVHPFPFQTYPPDAVVVAGGNPKPERVGVQEDVAIGRQIERHHARPLVLPWHDRQLERLAAGKTVRVLPGQHESGLFPDQHRRRANQVSFRLQVLAVKGRSGKPAISGGLERDRAAHEGRERAPADLLPLHSFPTEIRR